LIRTLKSLAKGVEMIKRKEPTKDDIIKAYGNEIIRLTEWVERLQEQLNEANELLKAYGTESLWESLSLSCDEANEYCKKWGVK